MNQKDSKRDIKAKAAAARAAAEAETRRRENRTRLLIFGVVGVLVVAIIGVGVVTSRKTSDPGTSNAALPTGVDATTYGWPVNSAGSSKPTLSIWEDFQCPVCDQLETKNGAWLQAQAAAGTYSLVYRITTFLDDAHPESNNASQRSAMAWGCAIDAGKGLAYHDKLYANQPQTEGQGWTDAQLLQYGKDVGITGSAYTTFASCVTAKTYAGWVANSRAAFDKSGVNGTPTGVLVSPSGKTTTLDLAQMSDQATMTTLFAQYSS